MSYRADQIKILELICAELPPNDFHNEQQAVHILEEELIREGLSYNESIILIKDMYEYIPSLNATPDLTTGKRSFIVVASEFIQPYLRSLKYPDYEDEQNYIYDLEHPQHINKNTSNKISITIDNKKGIYKTDNSIKQYPLGSSTQRMKIIKYLISHEKGSISNLQKQTEQITQVISQEIRRMNISFKDKLEVKDNLIIRTKTGGYYLNKESFDIIDNT